LQRSWFARRFRIRTSGARAAPDGSRTVDRGGIVIEAEPTPMFDWRTASSRFPSQPGRELPPPMLTSSDVTTIA
jgi:hypothetical protein